MTERLTAAQAKNIAKLANRLNAEARYKQSQKQLDIILAEVERMSNLGISLLILAPTINTDHELMPETEEALSALGYRIQHQYGEVTLSW